MSASPTPTSTTTPPHRPTFNTYLSTTQISAITSLILPHSTLLPSSITSLPTSQSYNNRIYFIETQPSAFGNSGISSTTTTTTTEPVKHVLKLSGYYFRDTKIQNEVGALLLLEKYCPQIPVPRVVAWSDDGVIINTVGGCRYDTSWTIDEETGDVTETSRVLNRAFSLNGWIFTTRLPGRILQQEDLDDPGNGERLIRKLAGYIAMWRKELKVPPSYLMPLSTGDDDDEDDVKNWGVRMGNIRFQDDFEKLEPKRYPDLLNYNDADADDDDDCSSEKEGKGTDVIIGGSMSGDIIRRSRPILPALTVGGLILSHTYRIQPLANELGYYTWLLDDQIERLTAVKYLQSLDEKIRNTVRLLQNKISKLSFFQSPLKSQQPSSSVPSSSSQTPVPDHAPPAASAASVEQVESNQTQPTAEVCFTHFDFAPRNILVSPLPLSPAEQETGVKPRLAISGILDFEFSAFAPAEEEFLNMAVRQPTDWTGSQYKLLVKELVRLGIDVPCHSTRKVQKNEEKQDASEVEVEVRKEELEEKFVKSVCITSLRNEDKHKEGTSSTISNVGKEEEDDGQSNECVCGDNKNDKFRGVALLTEIISMIAPWYIQEGSHPEKEELEKAIDEAAVIVTEGVEKLLSEFTLLEPPNVDHEDPRITANHDSNWNDPDWSANTRGLLW